MKIIFLFAILFAVGLNTSYAQNTWTQKADCGGLGRWAAVGFSIGSKGYIGTGASGTSTFLRDFWEYDPATNAWTQKANFGGVKRYAATGFSIGSKGYIGTGLDASNNYLKDFWEYDPATNTWTQKTDFGGTARYEAKGFSIGSKGYLGTGDDGNYKKDFWEYDPAINAWTQKTDFGGSARFYAAGFSIGSKGYLGTGSTSSPNVFNDFWEYDPAANTWTQKADFGGSARDNTVGFSIGVKGYIGIGWDGHGSNLKDFWEYDPVANKWTQRTDFGGIARTNALGLSIGGKGYIGTGVYAVGYKDFWEYTPDCLTGTTVYADADGDGYGNVKKSKINPTCDLLAGYVLDSTDCDDTNAAINPGAGETPGDGIDNNCNGLIDEKLNNALDFDGNDYITRDVTSLPTGSIMTAEAWIYPTGYSDNTWNGIVGWGGRSNMGSTLLLSIQSNGLPNMATWGFNDFVPTTGPKATLNTWNHIAVVLSGTSVTLYMNGEPISGTLGAVPNVLSKNLAIGSTDYPGRYFNGKIDEVRIWNVARTQAEIQADMLGGICGDQSGLVAAYSFNQGIAGGNNGGVTTLNDITANHNNGTLTNFALTGTTSNWVTGVPGLSDSTLVFKDADNDKYGNAAKSLKVPVCTIPNGYVLDNGDCNDTNASIHPGATETFNGIDDNCNGLIDEITGLSTTNITATTVTFNWNPLPGTVRYIVRYKPVDTTGGTSWVRLGVGSPAISVTVAGLVPNTKYKWVIKSVHDSVHTDFSGPVKFKTAAVLAINQQNKSSVKATVKEFVVYPNPTTGNVTINLTLAKKQSLFIKVFDVVGKEVYSSGEGMVSGTFTRQIDLSKLSPGNYFLKVVHDGETEVKAIVLKK